MNGGSISISIATPDLIIDNAVDSDSDASSDEPPVYYQPINDDGDDDVDDEDQPSLSNGHHVENGVTLFEDEDEDEIGRMSESDSAIRRAFLADEARRNAPLPPDNASRVIQAMRGVSFPSFPTLNVPDHLLLHQLHRLRLRLRLPPP